MNDTFTDNSTQDPAAIEQDIRRTQEDMSRTVDKIGDQLTVRNVFNALLDKADENDVDARYLLDGARRNPIALGLIAAGAIWLVSDKDSKFPERSGKSRFRNSDQADDYDYDYDVHHRDYVSHMSSVEWQEGEDELSYQRRRDLARANYLMVERNPGEDESSFRQRLDSMSEKFREKRRAWSDSASQTASRAGSSTRDGAQWAATRTQDFYDSNPLVGGILAAAVGAALGSSLPISRQEQDKLGSVGQKARDVASEQKDQIASKLSEKKDQVLEKADEKLQQSGTRQQSQSGTGDQSGTGLDPTQSTPPVYTNS
jgi:ElaB/YqjD/DUF883 family membrane-anchored ribosome-binding protein